MNFALSQRRPDRHPVGLMIVVGLHVLLAAALLSAKIVQSTNKAPPPIATIPLEPKPPEPKPKVNDLPKPPEAHIKVAVVPPPIVPPIDNSDAIKGEKLDVKPPPPVEVASIGLPVGPVREVARFTAHAGHIDAGAESCRPVYPASAQRLGVTGVTRVRLTIDAGGHVVGSQVLQASGSSRENRLMDKAAADALAQCPAHVGNDELGRATSSTADVDYVWTLN